MQLLGHLIHDRPESPCLKAPFGNEICRTLLAPWGPGREMGQMLPSVSRALEASQSQEPGSSLYN